MKKINLIYHFALAAILSSCNSGETQNPSANTVVQLPLYIINAQNVHTYQEFPAMLEGRSDVEIRPQVGGYLQKIFVDEGDFVPKGQVIFKIEDHQYIEALNNAKGMLNAAEAALINAKLEVEKLSPLVRDTVVSPYQLKSARASVSIAEANKKQAEAAVTSAKINLRYTTITAPVSGYITRLPKKQGSLVSLADPLPLTTLSDNAEIHAYFSMNETDFFAFGQKYAGSTPSEKIKNLPPLMLLLPDNTEYPQQGRIDMIDGKVDNSTGAITLRASFPNDKGVLRSGNTGKVRLGTPQQNVLVVPQSATFELQNKIYAFVVAKDGKAVKTLLNVIGKTQNGYLVKEGVKLGDKIVYQGFDTLQDGVIVEAEKIVSNSDIN